MIYEVIVKDEKREKGGLEKQTAVTRKTQKETGLQEKGGQPVFE
jgi:hypothetical protein